MSTKAQLEGQKFGDLLVLQYYKNNKWGSAIWECQCKCGIKSYVRTSDLIGGRITQCKFCASTKHGMYKTRIYSIWQGMKTRCSNSNAINYHNYGGRGISYPPRWKIFINFYNDIIENYKEGLTLERKDNNLNYSKENCMWVTPKEQNLNMRTNVLLCYKGETQTITEWSQELKIKRRLLYNLITYHKDWSDKQIIEEALKRSLY